MAQENFEESEFITQVGAEARIELVDWYGLPAIRKTRLPKKYRRSELDSKLRSRRTREEAMILYEAKCAGVDCPNVYFADPVQAQILMEFVKGPTLKELSVGSVRGDHTSNSEILNLFFRLGKQAFAMHSKNLIHGDLTTKNVIVSKDFRRLAMIDFGLS